ncbi:MULTISPECIES: GreA/GreB family elongation factor [Pseudomonas]|mgnify:CR=1 FL=1|jgi:transcription elongation GreA/GreB family factor|uniref:GreA/GreB family elongation factor n=1 Tax=Pseudomonas coleopterorum TaxID=1605838 RepID=A0ABR9C245_9PSED|nr:MULTISPECIES: GreA/GreB family elongation factor [Pseudomonas]KTC43148.1 transcription elongation factor GreAB [Pseudomonas putida]KQQ60564.1 transcription elongation factor GreAB [Pseudomonas sp. Leaf129]MBD8483189.1 GreA/GreB family elongation factor [Pseudomonas coleopterorum]MBD8756038.1 GreA/GreB family elongation factor [Pseudomonas coleopterorum]MBD8771200.1 GreA/GreB family elongation factor [Pseudomonas coleopterorum]
MSRAFVNEDHAAAQATQPVERLISTQPNYVTASGLAQLQARVTEVQILQAEQTAMGERADRQRMADLERDMRYYQHRLQHAQVVAPITSTAKVQIGSWVTFADDQGVEQRVCLVGEDQADAGVGLINWASPLGRALLGAEVGEERVWRRPAGDLTVEITGIQTGP